ncbi:hypothetical protein PAXRUDRAFT_153928, partial [Paxillus rubicundulus Ve08.2h10]
MCEFKAPCHCRDFIWGDLSDSLSPSVAATFHAAPVPRPALADHLPTSLLTLSSHPHLFNIICPINVDRFEQLLADHPNCPFVASVCNSLRTGFWPWADTSQDELPLSCDYSYRPPKCDDEAVFIRQQVSEEVALGCFSAPFGPDLLPGMYSIPVHAVPKPHSTKLRLIVDHSAGTHSLNSMIDRDLIAGIKMDGIQSLGRSL